MEEIRKQIILSKEKVLKLSQDTFIWHITENSDNGLLHRLKASIINKRNESFNSDVFILLEHKWYISIHTKMEQDHRRGAPRRVRGGGNDENHSVSIMLNCVTEGSVDCKVSYKLIQTNAKCEFYDSFDGNHWRRNSWRTLSESARFVLSQNANTIKTLNEITIKVDISIIADRSKQTKKKSIFLAKQRQNIQIDQAVIRWLTDIVKLPHYVQIFKYEAIDNMDIVKVLTVEHLEKMGIVKIGHQLKILQQIEMLNNKDSNHSVGDR